MFAGYLCYSPASSLRTSVDANTWGRVLGSCFATPHTGCWQQDGAMLVQGQTDKASSVRNAMRLARDENLGVAFWGRLDNRDQLSATLSPGAPNHDTQTDVDLVTEGWRRWGKALPEHLIGDFCLAITDVNSRQVFFARDPLGVKPLYYWLHPQGVLFGTNVNVFRCLNGLTPTKDHDWMARYMCRQSMSHDRTGYEEIMKLPGGHHLTVDGHGRQKLHRWHQWQDDAAVTSRRAPEQLEAYREALETAIRCRMVASVPQDGKKYRLGTENSGGIDSATITAYLAKFLGKPGDRLHTFGFATLEEEAAHIMATSRECNITHNYVVTSAADWDTQERAQHALKVLGYPEEHANGTYHTPFYRECMTRGISILFSGFGGDEVVTNNGNHIQTELLKNRQYAAVWNILRGNPITRTLRMIKALSVTEHVEYNPRFLTVHKKRWEHQVITPDFDERLGLYDATLESTRYDAPYRRSNDWIINGLLQMPYVPTRFENCTLMAASYGIDYRWPLWDVRLVQQYLSTPSIERVGPGGIGRYLHRRAITGTVPNQVAWKKSKSMIGSAAPDTLVAVRLGQHVETARRHEADLHPDVAQIIDRDKWQQQIKLAEEGNVPYDFGLQFFRTAQAIEWLNLWANDDQADRCAA